VNNQKNIVSLLDLAPRLKRPLSFWNPLDYFRLLYWAFFFPQAFPWYINTFGKTGYPDAGKIKTIEVLRQDPVQRRLVLQALIVLLITVSIAALGLSIPGLKINWLILAVGVTLGVTAGGIVGATLGIAFGVPFGITFGVMFSIAGNLIWIALNPLFIQYNINDFGAVSGTALGAAVGIALNAAGSVKSGVDDDVIKGITGGMFFMVVGGVFFAAASVIPSIATNATTNILSRNVMNTAFFSIGLGASFCLFFSRLTEYFPFALFAALHQYIFKKRRVAQAGRVVFLPLPGVRKQLEKELESDWENGIHNANQVLGYTLQYIPVVKAVKNILDRSPNDTLLSRISALVDRTIDWDLIRFCSSNINRQFRQKAKKGFLFLFLRKKEDSVKLRIDTPARAACAGFWYWYSREAAEAVGAFARVQDQRHGTELYYIAEAIDKWFEIEKDDILYKDKLKGIADWAQKTQRLKNLPETELRAGTLKTLGMLQDISAEIGNAYKVLFPLKRSQIVKQAIDNINQLIENGNVICLHPEWMLIKKIALKWKETLRISGWVFEEKDLRGPVDNNPYEGSSGRPVTGSTFIGRDDIVEKIEKHWTADKNVSTLLLYGQRRIGKTSILQNMVHRKESNLLSVYISIQNLGKVSHTGQFLLRFAEFIYQVVKKSGLQIGNPPGNDDYIDMGTGCGAFNRLLDKLAPQMAGKKRLILVIDEFEVIEEKIKDKQIDADFLPYLRSLIQQYTWLGIIFAGLHTLEEMGRDYQSAFYSQIEPLRVGFLNRDDAFKLIAFPHPRFTLEYSKELREELYRLTFGQPYLIQRLCWELVTRWNERFFQEGEDTFRELLMDDLPPILTSDFFESAAYYFDGVWENVTENERILMRIMAQRREGTWTLDDLDENAKTHPSFEKFSTLKETIDLLKRHDVILEEGGNVRFAAELMRRWVTEEKTG
jgi:hypothetical protein